MIEKFGSKQVTNQLGLLGGHLPLVLVGRRSRAARCITRISIVVIHLALAKGQASGVMPIIILLGLVATGTLTVCIYQTLLAILILKVGMVLVGTQTVALRVM